MRPFNLEEARKGEKFVCLYSKMFLNMNETWIEVTHFQVVHESPLTIKACYGKCGTSYFREHELRMMN